MHTRMTHVEIGLHAQNINTILDSIVTSNESVAYVTIPKYTKKKALF